MFETTNQSWVLMFYLFGDCWGTTISPLRHHFHPWNQLCQLLMSCWRIAHILDNRTSKKKNSKAGDVTGSAQHHQINSTYISTLLVFLIVFSNFFHVSPFFSCRLHPSPPLFAPHFTTSGSANKSIRISRDTLDLELLPLCWLRPRRARDVAWYIYIYIHINMIMLNI